MALPKHISTPDAGSGKPVLRLLVMADLAPGQDPRRLTVENGADGTAAALADLSPALRFSVANRLGFGPKEIVVALEVSTWQDFHPHALVQAVPILADLMAARAIFVACLGGDLDLTEAVHRLTEAVRDPELAQQVRAATGHAPALSVAAGSRVASSAPLDALLAQVEVPFDNLEGRPLAEVLAAPKSRAALPATIVEIDRRLARQVAEVAAAEPLRELEAAWRGVHLLATHAGSEVRLEVLPTDREGFLDAFYDGIFGAEHEGRSEPPLSAVVLGYELDRNPADVEVLRHLARMGESLQVPFLGAVGPSFWGLRQPQLLAKLPDLVRKVEGSEYAKWNGLRREAASLWLCLAANRLTLRDAWGGAGAPAPVTAFEWQDVGEADQPLHGSGAYALGAVLAQSFVAAGVRFPMTGQQPPAVLAGLPGPAPLEVLLSDQKALELARVGLAPLLARKGEADIYFPALPVVQMPKRYDREEATRAAAAVATLPYQAFAGMAAKSLDRIGRELGAGLPAEEVQRSFAERMLAFLESAGEASAPEVVQVEVQSEPENPDVWEVAVRLRPTFQVSGSDVDLVLGSAVPR